MGSMRALCDEAILIHDGAIARSGDPDEVARHYFQLNFAESGPRDDAGATAEGSGVRLDPGLPGRIADAWIENDDAERNPQGFERGAAIHVAAELEATRDIPDPVFTFEICAKDGTRVFATPLDSLADGRRTLAAGERVTYRASVVNSLAPGSYVVNCIFSRNERLFDIVDLRRPLAELVVWGDPQEGLVELDWRSQVEPAPGPRRSAGR